jgi:polysaccharide export outer membrane protein
MGRPIAVVFSLLFLGVGAGCQTNDSTSAAAGLQYQHQALNIREGDSLHIAFPGAPANDTTVKVRTDGNVTLPLIGVQPVTGMTAEELEKKLLVLYAPQLVSKEVTVTLISSSLTIFVNGSVGKPGKVVSDRPLTAFDAIMEAGGFDYDKADMKNVVVIREEGGQTKRYTVNLKLLFNGEKSEPFYLKPFDVVYVPQKFQWF